MTTQTKYKITDTTDNHYIGCQFIINDNNTINILDKDCEIDNDKVFKITYNNDYVRLVNPNFSISGVKI